MSAPNQTVSRWSRASAAFSSGLLGVVVLLAFVPFAFQQNTTQNLTQLLILVLLASMWNALAGFGGMISIGQQAFIGIGAYLTIILTNHGVNGFVAILLATAITGLISLPVSLVAFRLRGAQFAIGMWVIAEVFRLLLDNDGALGGGSGVSLTALNTYAPATRDAITFWMALGLTVALLVAVVVLLRSRLGSSVRAIRDDEVGAASLGVRVTRLKRSLFVLGCAGCGAAGSLILASSLFIEPNSIFSVQYSAYMIFMVLIGGLGTVEGPVIGAIIFYVIQQTFASSGTWYLIGLGAVAIAFTQILPRGIWGTIEHRFDLQLIPIGYRVGGRQAPVADEPPDDSSAAEDRPERAHDPKAAVT